MTLTTTNSIEKTITLSEFQRAGQLVTISFDNFSYKNTLSNGTIVSVLQIVDDYLDDLLDRALNIELDIDQYRKYKFKPKLLCRDIYGNGELYFIILLLNRLIDVKDFDMKRLKMLTKNDMQSLLNQIYNAEHNYMDEYNLKYGL